MEEEELTNQREIEKYARGREKGWIVSTGGDLSAVPLANFLWVSDCFNHFNLRFTIPSIIIRRN